MPLWTIRFFSCVSGSFSSSVAGKFTPSTRDLSRASLWKTNCASTTRAALNCASKRYHLTMIQLAHWKSLQISKLYFCWLTPVSQCMFWSLSSPPLIFQFSNAKLLGPNECVFVENKIEWSNTEYTHWSQFDARVTISSSFWCLKTEKNALEFDSLCFFLSVFSSRARSIDL